MRIVTLGEVLHDSLGSSVLPGGSPANVAFHVVQDGHYCSLVSCVGCDVSGDNLRDWVRQSEIDDAPLQRTTLAPTGTVTVFDAASGPNYDIAAPAAWDFIEVNDSALGAVHAAKVVVYGTLAQRHPCSRKTIRHLVDTAWLAGAVRFADLNLRSPHYDEEIVLWTLRHTDVLKLNIDELGVVSDMLGACGCPDDLFDGLLREFGIDRAVLTAGADGAWIYECGARIKVPAGKVYVVDAVGAGDAFAAMLVSGLFRGRSLTESSTRAARLAAWVAASRGGTPAWTAELRRALGD